MRRGLCKLIKSTDSNLSTSVSNVGEDTPDKTADEENQ